MIVMGITVPSFKVALEEEIYSWKDFRMALGKGNRRFLEGLFNQARSNCVAGNAVRPVVFEGMFMAIVSSHEKRLAGLQKAVGELRFETARP